MSDVRLREQEHPSWAGLPNTRYFEIDSTIAGARYAIWITTPPLYDVEPDRVYPVIYVTDGNGAAPMTISRIPLLRSDPINPIEPFVQVCVGYTAEDAKRSLAVRARDLLPPGEPLSEGVEDSIAETVTIGMLDEDGAKLYLHNLRNPAADKYLSFLTDELQPLIEARWRVSGNDAGLYGYSYGGLFSAYVALQRSRLFARIGAGSPGILPGVSRIFELYEAELAAEADYSGRHLHVTVCEREITVPGVYQKLVGAGTAEFLTLCGLRPLKGLTFTSRFIQFESHATGSFASWADFLRTCFPAKHNQGLLKV